MAKRYAYELINGADTHQMQVILNQWGAQGYRTIASGQNENHKFWALLQKEEED